MTDNWYINNNSKEEIDKNLQTLKAINRSVDGKTDPIKERITHIEDKEKNLIKERSTIESVRDIINEDKERDKIRKGMVKETLEKSKRQHGEKKEVIRTKLDIKEEIEKVNNRNDSLKEMVEKQNNKEEASSVQIICKRLEIEIDLQKEKEFSLEKDIKGQKSPLETSKGDRKNSEKLCRKIETKEEVGKIKDMLKPKDNSTLKKSLRRKPKVEEEIKQEIVNIVV